MALIKNRKRSIVCSRNVKISLLTTLLWRKLKKSSFVPQTSDGATWAHGVLFMSKVSIGPEINIFESHNCIVHTTQEKKVVIQGLDGYIIAENDDTLLICKLSEEQRIKNFSGNN